MKDLLVIDEHKKDDFVNSIKGIQNVKGQTIKVTQAELEDNYKLLNIEDCTIEMEGNLRMLWMKNIKRCKIIAPVAENSIMLIGAEDSEFVLAS